MIRRTDEGNRRTGGKIDGLKDERWGAQPETLNQVHPAVADDDGDVGDENRQSGGE